MKKLWGLRLLLILTGCSSLASKENINNLLVAPKLSRRESRIVESLNEYLGESITLKYQKQGNLISPVQLYDIDSDNIDEAIVFYNNPSTGGYVHFALMSQSGGDWNVVYNAEGNGSEVSGITFTHLLRNRSVQIVVAYGFQDSSEKVLSLYYTDKGEIVDTQIYTCQSYVVGDATGDRISDIVIAGVPYYDEYTQLQIITSDGNGAVGTVAQRPLLSSNTRVTNMAISKNDLSENPAILIDYSDINQFVHTQAVCLEKEEPTTVSTILEPDIVVKRWNFGYNIKSMDVDGDGYVEIPTVIDYELCLAKEIKVMEWTNFLSDTPTRKYFGICVGSNGVYIPLPDEWQNYIKIWRGENEQWICANASDDSEILSFEFVSMRNTKDESNQNIKYVNIGTLLAKFTFSEDVSEEQKSYITENIFYMK